MHDFVFRTLAAMVAMAAITGTVFGESPKIDSPSDFGQKSERGRSQETYRLFWHNEHWWCQTSDYRWYSWSNNRWTRYRSYPFNVPQHPAEMMEDDGLDVSGNRVRAHSGTAGGSAQRRRAPNIGVGARGGISGDAAASGSSTRVIQNNPPPAPIEMIGIPNSRWFGPPPGYY